jgi:hypothetical protein
MIAAGAAGNLLDRARLSHVTDFIDVGRFPTFNVADIWISVGVGIVLLSQVRDLLPFGRRAEGDMAANNHQRVDDAD